MSTIVKQKCFSFDVINKFQQLFFQIIRSYCRNDLIDKMCQVKFRRMYFVGKLNLNNGVLLRGRYNYEHTSLYKIIKFVYLIVITM